VIFGEPIVIDVSEELWVVAKPSGFAVHRASHDDIPDLVAWLREHGDAPKSIAPIHRLDRQTSGVVLLSPNAGLRAEVGALFAEGRVEKTYHALVLGRTHRKGVVRRRLKDSRRGKKLDAVTRYRCLRSFGRMSYLELRPETGRRHQIRRHLAGLGHNVVGDERYAPRRFIPVAGYPGRLWLHALRLKLPDGRAFEAQLAPELSAHLELLGERYGSREKDQKPDVPSAGEDQGTRGAPPDTR